MPTVHPWVRTCKNKLYLVSSLNFLLVASGYESEYAKYTGRLVYAPVAGEITYVDANKVVFKPDTEVNGSKKEITYTF
jgi:hypothetical protein